MGNMSKSTQLALYIGTLTLSFALIGCMPTPPTPTLNPSLAPTFTLKPSAPLAPTNTLTLIVAPTPNLDPSGCIVTIPANEDEWYPHFCSARGIDILASANVPHSAVQQAYSLVMHMFEQIPDEMQKITNRGIRLIIYEHKLESIKQVPEICAVVSGIGKYCPNEKMVVTYSDSLLCSTDEGWAQFTIHELAHALLDIVVSKELKTRLNSSFENAENEELWKGTYSMEDKKVSEYWAEGVRPYFKVDWFMKENGEYDLRDLASYDPMLFDVIKDFFRPLTWEPGCENRP